MNGSVDDTLTSIRRALHGVAELLLAGPQHAAGNGIRLRPVPGGFATTAAPDVRVQGVEVVAGSVRVPIRGTYAELARQLGVQARRLDDAYPGGPGVAPDDGIVPVDPGAAAVVADTFARGAAALGELAPDQTPVLWPEHFDLGVTLDEVNYGVSPGDDAIPTPYAYVGPHEPRTGDFWNRAFGAARSLRELPDVAAVVAFFQEGQARAAQP
jgi:hypothetical protein